MGAEPMVYPEEAGLPFGGDDFYPYLMLEIHYNNELQQSGEMNTSFYDSSAKQDTLTPVAWHCITRRTCDSTMLAYWRQVLSTATPWHYRPVSRTSLSTVIACHSARDWCCFSVASYQMQCSSGLALYRRQHNRHSTACARHRASTVDSGRARTVGF